MIIIVTSPTIDLRIDVKYHQEFNIFIIMSKF
jgi:hypothetical protein